jgi:hypothetical protein
MELLPTDFESVSCVFAGIAIPRNMLNKPSSISYLRGHGLLQCSQSKAEKSQNSHQNGHPILHQLGGKIAKNPADKKSDSNSHRPRSVSDVSLHTFGHKSAVGQMVANRTGGSAPIQLLPAIIVKSRPLQNNGEITSKPEHRIRDQTLLADAWGDCYAPLREFDAL